MRTTLLLLLIFQLFNFSTLLSQPVSPSYFVLGPFPIAEGSDNPDQKQQKVAFDAELLDPGQLSAIKEGLGQMYQGQSYQWRSMEAKEEYVDLDAFYSAPEYVYAYAYAEIFLSADGKRLVGIGSDDAVKVWLNGELVHENFIFRAHEANQDLLELNFKKGKNTLLIKVLDAQYAWGFSINFLTVDRLPELLETAASDGMLDRAILLLEHRADPNTVCKSGLTPWQAARIKGREDMCDLLERYGARSDMAFPAPEKLVESLFKLYSEGKKPGASVLVAQNGKILYQRGFGYANIEKGIPVGPETKFRIGSISKQFTAAAILKLVEEGKMKLDDKLSKYIPDFPRGDEVTIHHLLTHTSGIHSYTNEANFVERVTGPISWAALVQEIKAYEYDFDPGSNWQYNNSGYFILGYLVEQVSGMSFNAYLKKTFFAPLGMKNTGVHVHGKKLKNEALGYDAENPDSIAVGLDWDMSWAGGAGNLYSTVGDLFLWNEAIFNGRALQAGSLKAAHTPVLLNDGELPPTLEFDGYGYGWALTSFREAQEITHSGGLHGFLTNLSRLPGENLTVAVLTNSTPPIAKDPTQYTHDLIELFAWANLADQASFSVKENINYDLYDEYTGFYEYPGGALLEVTREGNSLMAKLADQPVYEIFPQTDTKFFWKEVDAQIEFFRDEYGIVTHGIHTQYGQTVKAPRVEPDIAIEVDPAIYDRYTGEYELGPVVITITREGDQIFAQVTGQPAFEIFPKSETEYFLKVVKAYITFVADDSGKVTHLELEQGGAKQKALRR